MVLRASTIAVSPLSFRNRRLADDRLPGCAVLCCAVLCRCETWNIQQPGSKCAPEFPHVHNATAHGTQVQEE